ncbi:MAG: SUMF1/EgtB/PvdO family nonheme iron enzyme, partial [Lachnospiraceae bacterium]|nr:SUMF1/EgtB/PvdO family nonheme iron enzyme [Lachnospiraceae bacterium]
DGSPQGLDDSNTNGWTATANKARTAVGNITNAVSALNICDLAGDVWKWLNELLHDPTGETWIWYDVLGSGYGQAYMANSTGLHALVGGGDWYSGVRCGSRAVYCGRCPWYVDTHFGVWCVCDSL